MSALLGTLLFAAWVFFRLRAILFKPSGIDARTLRDVTAVLRYAELKAQTDMNLGPDDRDLTSAIHRARVWARGT